MYGACCDIAEGTRGSEGHVRPCPTGHRPISMPMASLLGTFTKRLNDFICSKFGKKTYMEPGVILLKD